MAGHSCTKLSTRCVWAALRSVCLSVRQLLTAKALPADNHCCNWVAHWPQVSILFNMNLYSPRVTTRAWYDLLASYVYTIVLREFFLKLFSNDFFPLDSKHSQSFVTFVISASAQGICHNLAHLCFAFVLPCHFILWTQKNVNFNWKTLVNQAASFTLYWKES